MSNTLRTPPPPPPPPPHVVRRQPLRGRYRNVQLPRRGLLFRRQPVITGTGARRNMEEFFPRLFRVNPSLAQTLLYGHYRESKWLTCDLSNNETFCIDFKYENKCFVEILGWTYLELCEDIRIKNVEISFPFQHFHGWYKIVEPYVGKRWRSSLGR